jgi:inorganic pyrophosphatase
MNPETRFDLISPTVEGAKAVHVVVEIPKGSRKKYEIDKTTGLMTLDRCLYSSSNYPGDYGFVPQTLAEDGDALDVLVMINEATFSGCLIRVRVIGMFRMTDAGRGDHKLLGVPDTDPLYGDYHELSDSPSHFLREVENFFANYKQLEGGDVQTQGWVSATEAMEGSQASIVRYRDAHCEGQACPTHQEYE